MVYTVKCFSTKNNEFGILYDKNLVLHNFLSELQSDRYSCDWNPNFGSGIPSATFKKLTGEFIRELEDSIREVASHQDGMELLHIQSTEGTRSITFSLTIHFLFDNNPNTNTIQQDFVWNFDEN